MRSLTSAVEEGVARGRTSLWIPLLLLGGQSHANALHINTAAKRVVHYEPHGFDVAAPGQSTFRHFYSPRFHEDLRAALGRSLPGYTIVVASDWQKAVEGQSVSGVLKSGGDPWCVLWCLLFLRAMWVSGDHVTYAQRLAAVTQKGGLKEMVIRSLTTRAVWMAELTAPKKAWP